MKNLTEYSYHCMEAMYNYSKNGNKESLIKFLRRAEKHAQNEFKNEGDLWFKFSEDDTLATTISDLEADLSLPTKHSNHQLRVEAMRSAAVNGELQVFFTTNISLTP